MGNMVPTPEILKLALPKDPNYLPVFLITEQNCGL